MPVWRVNETSLILIRGAEMREILAAWTYDTLKSDPNLYGGDHGNPLIMIKYLQETSTNDSITLITKESMSNAVSVSRLKNGMLLEYPELDHRTKNKPKERKWINPNQGTLFSMRDYLSDSENKILDYLEADIERWDYSASTIRQFIGGVETQEIECVLRHKELYQMETRNSVNNESSGFYSCDGESA